MRLENPKQLLELLVQEFRLWQELAGLIQLERRLLIEGDMLNLVDLGRHKGELLAEIFTAQQSRRKMVEAFFSEQPGTLNIENLPWTTDPVELPMDERERLLKLAAGIQALAGQVGELAQPNYALADCAIKRVWAINGWRQQEKLTSLPPLLASILDARVGSNLEALHPFAGENPRTKLDIPVPTIEEDLLTLVDLELVTLLG